MKLGIIYPTYTKSFDQLSDIFTKKANTKVCNHIQGKLGLLDLGHDPLSHGVHTLFSLNIDFLSNDFFYTIVFNEVDIQSFKLKFLYLYS